MDNSNSLSNEDIRYFAIMVVKSVQDYFFYQNTLKYSCVEVNSEDTSRCINLLIIDSIHNYYNGSVPVDDITEFKGNILSYIDTVAKDVIRCFKETYYFIMDATSGKEQYLNSYCPLNDQIPFNIYDIGNDTAYKLNKSCYKKVFFTCAYVFLEDDNTTLSVQISDSNGGIILASVRVDINKLSSAPYRRKRAIWLFYRALQQYNETDYFHHPYVERPTEDTVE